MARILSISNEDTLLRTRHLLLERRGHQVISVLGLEGAIASTAEACELAVIGHSIQPQQRLRIIQHVRQTNPRVRVIGLTRYGDPVVDGVDQYVDPDKPEEFLRAIDRILDPNAERRRSRDAE